MTTMRETLESLYAKHGSLMKSLTELGYPPSTWGDLPEEVKEALGLNVTTSAPACTICGDMGQVLTIYTRDGEEVERKLEPCRNCERGREEMLAVYNRWFEQSGIPSRFKEFTFETWEKTLTGKEKAGKLLAYQSARLLVEHRPDQYFFRLGEAYGRLNIASPLDDDPARNSLVLYGDLGVGKTGLSASIARALADFETVLCLRVQSLIKQVQDTYNADYVAEYGGETRSMIVDRVKTAPFLILDEMTMEKNSDDRREILEEIMRYRCGRELPFVVTTNHDQLSFLKQWGGRTADVMFEAAHWVPMGGSNIRRKAQPLKAI